MLLLKKILTALILPPFGPLALALIGLWLSRKHPRGGRALAVTGIVGLMLLSLPPVGTRLLASLDVYPPISAGDLARAQAIVVLGGGRYRLAPEYAGEDTINARALERLRYAAFLQARSGLPLLVTGGAIGGGRPEALAMKEAIERDFHGTVRWTESASLDTAENAAFSAMILQRAGLSRIVLVSHGWHLPRAVAAFERQGLTVLPAPTIFTTLAPDTDAYDDVLPSMNALEKSHIALREWLGRLVEEMRRK